ncbi:MAG: hypothetical protein ACC655_03665 [Rhodothermia bacterium]
MDRKPHWEEVFRTKPFEQASWFQSTPSLSLDLIESTGLRFDSPIIDVGGGASTLVDRLLEESSEDHKTPSGATQQFIYCRFRRV